MRTEDDLMVGELEVGDRALSALADRSRALEIILGSEDLDADTAQRYGWINRALPDAPAPARSHPRLPSYAITLSNVFLVEVPGEAST